MKKSEIIQRIHRHLRWLARHNHPELTAMAETLRHYRETLYADPEIVRAPVPEARDIVTEVVTEFTGLSYHQICRHNRQRERVDARHQCIWLLREYTEMTMAEIAFYMGERHRTSVLHSLKVANGLLSTCYREPIAAMRAEIDRRLDQIKKLKQIQDEHTTATQADIRPLLREGTERPRPAALDHRPVQ